MENGGIARAILDLCPVLERAGHQVTLLTSDDEDVPDLWKRTGRSILVPPASLPGQRFPAAAMRAIMPHLRDADVLHLHGMWDLSNLQLAAAARRIGLPYV